MSDVQSAAERLRAMIGNLPRHAEEFTLADIRVASIIVDQYLREHPADSELPITEEWLRSIGATVLWDVEKEFRFPAIAGTHLAMFCPTKEGGYSCCLGGESSYAPLPDNCTRGDLRRLCAALGIPLKEQA